MINILGIRHHGPGSARNVKDFLENLQPDIVLVEGPVEADGLLDWTTNAELKPPVAILCYQPDNPNDSIFYPFAEFSPEWQAIKYAKDKKIPVRFMDLPITNFFAVEKERKEKKEEEENEETDPPSELNNSFIQNNARENLEVITEDPFLFLANAAGFNDGEKWWEHMFEHRRNSEGIFDAIDEMMAVLRLEFPKKDSRLEQQREASMRKIIRQAEKEMFTRIAVICGAWHVPALKSEVKAKDDNELLKGLPKLKVECTWIPWTYNRLSFRSGYGAGIHSPGWYDHIWNYPDDNGTLWMAKVAKLFREKQMDTSVAHVIEAVRLAESLASLRNLSKAGLEELNESTQSILCNGEQILLQLVHDELIVSDRIGSIPQEVPRPPLQLDIEKLQKKLRLPPTADWKDYVLDLRKEMDLERSIFLHRLSLLDIKWGIPVGVSGKGTFKEQWRLQWAPEFSIDIIDKGSWGNTTEEAASKYSIHLAQTSPALPAICSLLDEVIPAEIPESVEYIINSINTQAAAAGDIMQLMSVVPGLVRVSRYGNVRKTDATLVLGILRSLITRICINLPTACSGIDEESADHICKHLQVLNEAITLLEDKDLSEQWNKALQIVSGQHSTAPIIGGYSTRLLSDGKLLEANELVSKFYQAMSSANPPQQSASWLEGFLKGSGTVLLMDDDLWNVLNNWVSELDETIFVQVLPLLRRTFSAFSIPEKRRIGEKVNTGSTTVRLSSADALFNHEKGSRGLSVVMKLLGYKMDETNIVSDN